jgi:protocatechuate 3,4-dioxygenase beta subunit
MEHDRELFFDGSALMHRRNLLKLLAGAGVVTLVGCASSKQTASSGTASTAGTTDTSGPSSSAAVTDTTATATATSCSPIPEETAGPYPGDGSNGPNVLSESGIVRRDITSSFGSAAGIAQGVPTTVRVTLLGTSNGCAPLSGAAVYLWHCDREGRYSLYSDGVTGENYLRGVQASDGDGVVTFESIFPACYSGRWPHIHFEVYSSLDDATSAGEKITTSQIALPAESCNAVFASDGYEQSIQNLGRTSLETDNVFADDGGVHELATVTGSVDKGYAIALTVPV